jgi:hypothetical protein
MFFKHEHHPIKCLTSDSCCALESAPPNQRADILDVGLMQVYANKKRFDETRCLNKRQVRRKRLLFF